MKQYDTTLTRARTLGTNPAVGLSADAVERSRAAYGANRLPEAKTRPIWKMFLAALGDKTLIILMMAAVVAIGVEVLQAFIEPGYQAHYLDGIAILCAVMIASVVTTINDARAAKQFQLLSRVRGDVPIKTLRTGHVGQISIHELVVGDIVYFDPGDRLPADGMLLSGVDVSIDQSLLTGESMPVDKNAEDLDLRGGTTISSGSGAMLLTAVGVESEVGKLHLSLAEQETETPLQERLGKFADQIGIFGLVSAVLTFAALVISGLAGGSVPLALELETLKQLLGFLIIAVTIIVVAVPEGLPLAVTMSLAYSVRKMARDNNLVRRLASCETMGAATVICSDKTGTLTQNRMAVVAARIGDRTLDEAPHADRLPPAIGERIAQIASINSTAFLETVDGRETYVGNPTEGALLSLIAGWGEDWKARRESAQVLRVFGFTSERKRMSTLMETEAGSSLLVKGAPEMVLRLSSTAAQLEGEPRPLAGEDRQKFGATIEAFSGQGYRTLALAYRDLPAGADPADAAEIERDLTLLAVLAIADPVRPEVADAVRASRGAGLAVKMVTGDNLLTARTIGRQIGLLEEGDVVLTGKEFGAASDEELLEKLDSLRILARSVPSDKLRLVNLLQRQGHVVAVTGDGTNDAPALHAADVGFSMGVSGTEVAKEASDIVLLDDNFASIVTGILWGRSIFENIRKFLQFQLTVNVVAVSTAFLAAVFGFGTPLNTVQLLWVNLIMDTMAALALATEPPRKELFQQPPHGRHAPLITKGMAGNILLTSATMLALLLMVMWTDWLTPGSHGSTRTGLSPIEATYLFNVFVMLQIFNEINARSTRADRGVFRGFFDSHIFIGVLAVTIVTQVLIVEFGGSFFRTVPLPAELWLSSIGLGASILLFGALFRFVARRRAHPDPTLPSVAPQQT